MFFLTSRNPDCASTFRQSFDIPINVATSTRTTATTTTQATKSPFATKPYSYLERNIGQLRRNRGYGRSHHNNNTPTPTPPVTSSPSTTRPFSYLEHNVRDLRRHRSSNRYERTNSPTTKSTTKQPTVPKNTMKTTTVAPFYGVDSKESSTHLVLLIFLNLKSSFIPMITQAKYFTF